jgi:hypothetical protein
MLSAAEISILSLCGYVVFRRRGYTFSEAWAFALISVLMAFSLLFQLAFLVHHPALMIVVEGIWSCWAVVVLWRERHRLTEAVSILGGFFKSHPAAGWIIAGGWVYLTGLALWVPPDALHWELLGRTLTMLRPAADSSPVIDCALDSPLPLNTVALPYLFLRHQTDIGVGLIGCMAYLSIGFSTYALARRYAWPPTAITVSLVVLSMPRFVLLATTPGFEIVPAAAALFCLLAAYRVIEAPNPTDLWFLIWGILFSIHAYSVFLAVPALMLPLTAIMLFRRHGVHVWWKTIKKHGGRSAAALLPALVFSQVWLIAWHRLACSVWAQNPPALAVLYNPDGIQGALANMGRYLLQSAHLTQPVESLLFHTTGLSISQVWEGIHRLLIQNFFGNQGAALPFQIRWSADQRFCWFGPFGFLLILPAIAYAVRRAPRRLKAIAIAAVGYFFLVSLVLAWQPENVRFFDFFFACGGFCTALFLTPWRVSARGRRALQVAGAILMIYASAFNHHKPALGFRALTRVLRQDSQTSEHVRTGNMLQLLVEGSIWRQALWGPERLGPARRFFGDDRVIRTVRQVPASARLWVIAGDAAHAYPFLLRLPSASYVPARHFTFDRLARAPGKPPLYLVFADRAVPERPSSINAAILWRADSERQNLPGGLVRIDGAGGA